MEKEGERGGGERERERNEKTNPQMELCGVPSLDQARPPAPLPASLQRSTRRWERRLEHRGRFHRLWPLSTPRPTQDMSRIFLFIPSTNYSA